MNWRTPFGGSRDTNHKDQMHSPEIPIKACPEENEPASFDQFAPRHLRKDFRDSLAPGARDLRASKDKMSTANYAPVARVIIRDAEWLVRRVDRTSAGGQCLSFVGLFELVRRRKPSFFTTSRPRMELTSKSSIEPKPNSSFRDSLRCAERLLRQTPTNEPRKVRTRPALQAWLTHSFLRATPRRKTRHGARAL